MYDEGNAPMEPTQLPTGSVCTQCGQSKSVPVSIIKPAPTTRSKAPILIEPKNFCRIPMC